MTVSGRRLPFAGIAKAIDCMTATKGWSRPNLAVHGRGRECRKSDRKTAIAQEAIIVRRGILRDRPLFYLIADVLPHPLEPSLIATRRPFESMGIEDMPRSSPVNSYTSLASAISNRPQK
jgi:hypothetical protein